MNIFIDDAIRKLLEMKNDGYCYCSVEILPEDEVDGDIIPGNLSFSALDKGADIDYDGEDAVEEVPNEELEQYAEKNRAAPHFRNSIKRVKLIQ